jgi:hyperosmotically inducible periplasmic protein
MKTSWIMIAGLSLALLGGCTRGQQSQVNQEAQGLGAKVQQAAANGALEAKVKMALATRKDLKGTDIRIEANGPVVTLKGDVNTREQAAEAVKVAQGNEGVTTVNNQLALRVPVKGTGGGP